MQQFGYVRPRTPAEAVFEVTPHDGMPTKFLAGGTTLVDLMKHGVEAPGRLVDLTGVSGLDDFVIDGDELRFGALVKMSAVADHPAIKERHPMLSEALWRGASQQLRNMATLGGNVLQRTRCAYFRDTQFPCNKRAPGTGCSAIAGINRGHAILGGSPQCIAVYPGDWAIALSAADASFDTVSLRGTRTISIHDLHVEPGDHPQVETILAPDELIVRTRIPVRGAYRASTYQKLRDRASYAFALASAAVALDMDGDRVRDARIAIGGVATKPWRARSAEHSLIGTRLTAASAQEAGRLALSGATTTPSNAFRVPLGAGAVAEAVMIAKERA
jgi:xanthine dehydrogenase YagS FAD-binding subunit